MGRQGDDHSTARFKARKPFLLARLPFWPRRGAGASGATALPRARACFFFFLRRGAGGAGAQGGGASGARGARAPVWPAGRNSARAPAPQGHTSTFRGACVSAQDARGRSRPALHSVLPAASRGARSRAPPRGGRRELAPTAGPEASAPTKRSRCAAWQGCLLLACACQGAATASAVMAPRRRSVSERGGGSSVSRCPGGKHCEVFRTL